MTDKQAEAVALRAAAYILEKRMEVIDPAEDWLYQDGLGRPMKARAQAQMKRAMAAIVKELRTRGNQ